MGEMTNEQAARWLKDLLKSDLPMEQYQTAIKKGIEALKPSGDLISREGTLTAFADYVGSGMSMNDYEALSNIVENMPPVKQEPCEDAISRQAVLDCLTATNLKKFDFILDARDKIKNLPPVTPQPKIGHWIEKDGYGGYTYYDCSECGRSWITIGGTPWNQGIQYCPNCGVRMESEDK